MRVLTDESLTDQLRRERLLDMEARLVRVRRQAHYEPADDRRSAQRRAVLGAESGSARAARR